jgi:hypothetical protein
MKKKHDQPDFKDELRPEYDLSNLLKEGVRGKYTARYQMGTNLVLLDPDVAQVFTTDESVNEALRLAIKMVKIQKRKKRNPVSPRDSK